MTVAAIYARFSSDAQREESIEIQVRECTRYIEREGWQKGAVFADYAISGRIEDRPQFKRAIAAAITDEYDVLVVYKLDRFARNVEVAQRYRKQLFDCGKRFVSVREGEQLNTPDGFLFSGIGDLFAEYYSRNLSVLVRNGIRQSARDHRAAGRRIFGYDVDENDRFVIDGQTGPVVQRIFRDYVGGKSATQICEALNADGLRTRAGNKWQVSTLMNVLRNEAYRGRYEYDGEVAEGVIPPLVDDATFEAAKLLRARRKSDKRLRRVNRYVLTDKLYCLECGHRMCGTAGTSHTGKKYVYYGCVKHLGGCGNRVSAEDAEESIIAVLQKLLSKPDQIELMVDAVMGELDGGEDLVPLYKAERDRLDGEVTNFVKAIAAGVDVAMVKAEIDRRKARMDELDALIMRERAARARPYTREDVYAYVNEMIASLASGSPMLQTVVQTFIHRIFITKGGCVMALAPQSNETGLTLDDARRYLAQDKKENPLVNQGVLSGSKWSG